MGIPKDGAALVTLAGHPICTIAGKPDLPFLARQLEYLRNYADLRLDRLSEINQQIYDLLSFMGALGRLDSGQKAKTLEFLTIVQKLTFDVEMRVKHACWCPRPIDLSDYVMPMIQTPDHSSFPSGHASESFALATALDIIQRPESTLKDGLANWRLPFRLAHRIAVNRTVAGVHFPVDSAAGSVLGIAIGAGLCALGKATLTESNKALLKSFVFEPLLISTQDGKAGEEASEAEDNPFQFGATEDFETGWLRNASEQMPEDTEIDMGAMPILGTYWQMIAGEWHRSASGDEV
ncbi:MAG: phosphatase PAP2 family protein [Pseudomonadota bacterium]